MYLKDETFGQAWMMTIADGPDINDEERGHWYSPTAVAKFIADEREACAALAEETAAGRDAEAIAEAIRMRSNVELTGAAPEKGTNDGKGN